MARVLLSIVFAAAVAVAQIASAAPAPPAAPAPLTTAQAVERCKRAPDPCLKLIADVAGALNASREACIPRNVPRAAVQAQVMDTAEEIVEEAPDEFRDFDYKTLVGQIIAFTWPCGVVS